MVDIGEKDATPRTAVAAGKVLLQASTVEAIRERRVEKGDILAAAEVAALQAVKKVWEVLPHCHPIPLTGATVDLTVEQDGVSVSVRVSATYKTGVEMEALYGAAVALLTVWDMVKALEKDESGQYPFTRIHNLHVEEKAKHHGA